MNLFIARSTQLVLGKYPKENYVSSTLGQLLGGEFTVAIRCPEWKGAAGLLCLSAYTDKVKVSGYTSGVSVDVEPDMVGRNMADVIVDQQEGGATPSANYHWEVLCTGSAKTRVEI